MPNEIDIARIASAIGDPSRARMLCCLLDGRARTSTELAMIAEVSPSTASAHLSRLKAAQLLKLLIQGKHRYFSLESAHVAAALESLLVVAGRPQPAITPSTPEPLRRARTCYDHMAGAVAVALNKHFRQSGWLKPASGQARELRAGTVNLTPQGKTAFESLGIDVDAAQSLRRRFAYDCLDWSERKPHIGGALGAALLELALKKRWVQHELEGRALRITRHGQRELAARFEILL